VSKICPAEPPRFQAKSQGEEVVRLDFAEWFRHARQGRRCVIFRDPTYNAKTGGKSRKNASHFTDDRDPLPAVPEREQAAAVRVRLDVPLVQR
jgi:hypothetical protein